MIRKIESYVYIVILIIIVSLLGASFAYFVAATATGDRDISGETLDFGVSLDLNAIRQANSLIPLSNNLVTTAITKENNKCIDKYEREVCSLYSIALSNTGSNVILNPYITTINSTYETSNLKCQIYDSSYNAISDIVTLSHAANDVTYITSNNSNLNINLSSNSQVYYLVIWISEESTLQSSDYSKIYNATLTLSLKNGEKVFADFSA